jgi:hypothetical protein
MSLKKIKKVIENFIIKDNNDALAINGRYGVGKTFYWKELIQNASEENKPYYQGMTKGEGRERRIGKPFYAYISLFGIDNLESLKNAVFTEIVWSKDVGSLSNRSSITSKGLLSKIESIPHIQKFTGGMVSAVAFQEVKNALICFDDIDRKSDKLKINEVIGLANLLKEHHNCKIVLILNEDKLNENNSEYRTQVEKLIDFEIKFAPDTEEILDVVFPYNYPNNNFIKTNCRKLKINNIRTLQKIRRFLDELLPQLTNLQTEVIKEVLHSIVLFVWAHYNKEDNPPTMEFLEDFGTPGFYLKKHGYKEKLSEQEQSWETKLTDYGHRVTDDLQKILLFFVKNGYLDENAFNEKILIKNEEIAKQQGQNKYLKAWSLFHNSFDENEEKFIQELCEGFRANMKSLSISNLNETVDVLRKFDSNNEANKLVDDYIDSRFDSEALAKIRIADINFNANDAYLRQKFIDKINKSKEKITLSEALDKYSSSGSYHLEEIEYLASFSVEEFYDYFKSFSPPEFEDEFSIYFTPLINQIKFLLGFVGHKENPYKTLGENVKKAIVKIAQESRINKLRVTTWFKISEQEIEKLKKKSPRKTLSKNKAGSSKR